MNSSNLDDDNLTPWSECDYFCINHYAGTGSTPCGWRGRRQDTLRATVTGAFVCPRCGSTTLLRLPLVPLDANLQSTGQPR